jgi:UPF0716 family protein affecting phage T7 exclusion
LVASPALVGTIIGILLLLAAIYVVVKWIFGPVFERKKKKNR